MDLTLLEHLERCQKRYGRPVKVGADMLSAWRSVGHDESSLRQVCRRHQPDTQHKLKMILIKELQGLPVMPATFELMELVAETAEYFLPSDEPDLSSILEKKAAVPPPLEVNKEEEEESPPLSLPAPVRASASTPAAAEPSTLSFTGLRSYLLRHFKEDRELRGMGSRYLLHEADAVVREVARTGLQMDDLIRMYSGGDGDVIGRMVADMLRRWCSGNRIKADSLVRLVFGYLRGRADETASVSQRAAAVPAAPRMAPIQAAPKVPRMKEAPRIETAPKVPPSQPRDRRRCVCEQHNQFLGNI